VQALIGRLVELSWRHAGVLAATILLLAAGGGAFAIRHISFDTDINNFINPHLPWREREAALDRAFPQNVDLLVIVIDAASPDQAEDAAAALAAKLRGDPTLFENVRRPDDGRFLRRNGLLLLSTAEVQDFADRLIAAQPLIGTLAADPSLRGMFTAIDLMARGATRKDTGTTVPDPAFDAVASAVEASVNNRHEPLSWHALFIGNASSASARRRFILTRPVLDYAELLPGARATAAIHAAAGELGLDARNGVTVRVTGPVALSDAEFATLAEHSRFSSILSIGLLCLWLLLGLRSLRTVLAILTTLIVGLIGCTAFAVGITGPLNPISVAFAVLFVGIAVDFGIQFGMRYRDERLRAGDARTALGLTARGIGGPLTIAAATTAAGFFAFVPTDYRGVSDLGLIAGVGMLLALVLNLTLLPALLTLLRPPGARQPVGFRRAAALDGFLLRHRGAVMLVALLLAAGSIAALPALRFDFNPLHLENPRQEAVSTLLDLTSDPNATPYTIEILRPSVAAAVALAHHLDALPEVARVVTAASFVPSEQPEKLVILRDAAQLLMPTLSPPQIEPAPDGAEVLAAMARCARDLKKASALGSPAAARLARALDDAVARGSEVVPALRVNLASSLERRLDDLHLGLSAEPVTLSTLPHELRSEWIAADGEARVEVFPKGDTRDNEALRRFVAAVQRIAPDAMGTPVTIQESAHTITRAFAVAGIIALAATALLLALVLRRARDVLLVFAPLLLAGLLTMATSALFGSPLNFANIIALPLLLAIGVAFDIYFVMRWRLGEPDPLQSSTARAILFSALTTGTAFGSLALSNHPGTAEIGKLLTLGLGYTLLGIFFVLPALLGPARR
jgi:uncharacterized protein